MYLHVLQYTDVAQEEKTRINAHRMMRVSAENVQKLEFSLLFCAAMTSSGSRRAGAAQKGGFLCARRRLQKIVRNRKPLLRILCASALALQLDPHRAKLQHAVVNALQLHGIRFLHFLD